MIHTPHTRQLVEYKGRWKNSLFTKEYFRMKQRKNLREPYINENGEHRGKKKYIKTKVEKEICWLCNREIFKNFMNVHLNSKDHIERHKLFLQLDLNL